MMLALALVFVFVGIISALVGLGGGSFYLLSMELFRVPVTLIPVIALTSNIFVSGIGSAVRLLRRESCSLLVFIMIIIPSMSMSYLGASLRFQENVYRILFNCLVLLIVIGHLLLQRRGKDAEAQVATWAYEKRPTKVHGICMGISAVVGFVSGIVGIGGGIILGPLLHMYGMSYKNIPVITSIYILLNSSLAIIVHLSKIDAHLLLPYLFLPIISIVISLITMYTIIRRLHVTQIRNIAMGLMIVIALYNLVRAGVEYAG